MQKRGLIAIRTDPRDGRSHSILADAERKAVHDELSSQHLRASAGCSACLRKGRAGSLIDLLGRPQQSSVPSRDHDEPGED